MRRLFILLLVSLALHLALGAWLLTRERVGQTFPAPEVPTAVLLEMEIVTSAPPTPAPAPAPAPAPRVSVVTGAAPRAKSNDGRASSKKVGPHRSGSKSEVPKGEDLPLAPPARTLEPAPLLSPSLTAEAVPRSGRTQYPGDPEFSEEVQRLEEQHRVETRLRAVLEDSAAAVRAQRGAKHPYWDDVEDRVGTLGKLDGGTPAQLGSGFLQNLTKQYLDAAESYGHSGDPGLGAPPKGPTAGETQKPLNGALQLRTFTQMRETLNALERRGPLFSVVIEMNQGRGGELLRFSLLESSGSAPFDHFVLQRAPEAIAQAGSPPLELLRGRETLRSQWAIEGWLKSASPLEEKLGMDIGFNFSPIAERDAAGSCLRPGDDKVPSVPEVECEQGLLINLPSNLTRLPVDKILDALGDDAEFDYRARLLRIY